MDTFTLLDNDWLFEALESIDSASIIASCKAALLFEQDLDSADMSERILVETEEPTETSDVDKSSLPI